MSTETSVLICTCFEQVLLARVAAIARFGYVEQSEGSGSHCSMARSDALAGGLPRGLYQ